MKTQNASLVRFAVIGALALFATACASTPDAGVQLAGATVPTGVEVAAPLGYQAMCRRTPDLCSTPAETEETAAPLTRRAALSLLSQVNRTVNRTVRPRDDNFVLVGDDWRRPTDGAGDCEDYALEKREQLRLRGFPSAQTFLAVVYSREAGLHTVLVATVEGRDYVMDNRSPWVLPWRDAPYEWVKREAQHASLKTPGRWALALATSPAPTLQRVNLSRTIMPDPPEMAYASAANETMDETASYVSFVSW